MNELKGQCVPAPSGTYMRSEQCESIATQPRVAEASDEPVSPAISLAISPSTDENYKTESDGNQSSNKSGSQRSEKPDCYMCKHRRNTEWSHHSRCAHPSIFGEVGQYLECFFLVKGLRGPAMKRMNVSGSVHGFNNGWFFWPINFDPVWLETCDGFERQQLRGDR